MRLVARSSFALALLLQAATGVAAAARGQAIMAYEVAGDAIPSPLGGLSGDPARGRMLVLDREAGNCLICHHIPVAGEPSQGDLGPPLAGVAGRLTVGQLRFRLVDASRLNPSTTMPPYFRVNDLNRVASRYRDRPVFSAQQIEDIVAWLATLKP